MMRILQCIVLLLSLQLAGCISTPQNSDQRADYWAKRPHTVVVIAQPEAPQFNRRGNRKLINNVLSHNTDTEVATALASVNLMKRLERLRRELSNTLKSKRIPYKWERQAFDMASLTNRKGKKSAAFTEHNFSAARSNWPKAQFILLIELPENGSIRPYYGVVPTGNPGGYAVLQVRLIDLETNRIAWSEKVIRERSVVGAWDTPPHYAALQTAMVKALIDACAVVQRAFSYPNAFR